jgi:hypothetical protein
MGNSNKKGKKEKNKEGKKGKDHVGKQDVSVDPLVSQPEESIEPDFVRDQYDKAKNAVVDSNVGDLLSAIEGMQVNMKDPEDSHNT